jgi:hypothetical protein
MAERCASESPPHIGLKRPCGDSDGASAAVDFVSQSDAVPPNADNAEMDAQCTDVISTGKGPASSADWAYDRRSSSSSERVCFVLHFFADFLLCSQQEHSLQRKFQLEASPRASGAGSRQAHLHQVAQHASFAAFYQLECIAWHSVLTHILQLLLV